MGLLDYLKEQKDAALNDYAGLLGAYPNANKFMSGLLSNIEAVAPPDPRDQQASQQFAMNRVFDIPGGMAGAITAYHGSPHKFDAFDMSKIGTGEGAQAYGHGLYFAESPEVAKSYQDILTRKTTVNGQPIIDSNKITGSSGNDDIDNYLIAHHGDAVKAIESLKSDYDDFLKNAERGGYFDHYDKEYQNNIKTLQSLIDSNAIETTSGGQLYKTSLEWPDPAREAADPLGPQHFLDWDKPLSEQPESIRSIFNGMGIDSNINGFDAYKTIEQKARESKPEKAIKQFENRDDALAFYNQSLADWKDSKIGDTFKPIAKQVDGKFSVVYPEQSKFNVSGLGPVEDASAYLNKLGIPGIRYLDGGSRGAGEGSYNYVVFSDQIPRIVERNGKGLLGTK